jgi:hypothetical protein
MSPLKARACAFVDSNLLPTIQAALETYLELDTADALALCAPALACDLAFEMEDIARPNETFERPRR